MPHAFEIDDHERRFLRIHAEWSALPPLARDPIPIWERAVSELAAQEATFRAEGKWTRGRDDMFGVLGIARREVRHSALIAWLLDPSGRHGLGDRVLRAFLARAFPDDACGDLSRALPQCEVARGQCRADIVVWAGALTLVVEAKVDAVESPRQCDLLYELFANEPGARFVFLTPSGRAPTTATGDARSAWAVVSFRDVLRILEEALLHASDRTSGRLVAEDYVRTLRREFR